MLRKICLFVIISCVLSLVSATYLDINRSVPTTDEVKHYVLYCHPPGGTHPKPVQACEKIASVHGNLSLLTPAPAIDCIAGGDAVTVEVKGRYNNRRIHFKSTYPNGCLAYVVLGDIYA
ncbi:hypothetical protein CU098_006289 [Rhizopus stolonifer]|uniref:Subtilisin inhibitor domain-containing protein n=1 Tax=Rhizopus stolonifer TaxID=4846 RepID=A0A367IRV1_RHIST|nr:hypothetical protein CU098_006289 [Rhizopus stolonifer]